MSPHLMHKAYSAHKKDMARMSVPEKDISRMMALMTRIHGNANSVVFWFH